MVHELSLNILRLKGRLNCPLGKVSELTNDDGLIVDFVGSLKLHHK